MKLTALEKAVLLRDADWGHRDRGADMLDPPTALRAFERAMAKLRGEDPEAEASATTEQVQELLVQALEECAAAGLDFEALLVAARQDAHTYTSTEGGGDAA